MSNFDFLSLSGQQLQTFLAVLEEGSISIAANKLGVTQSAVSHTLEKLRLILGDPLFVRAGRGIEPTTRAKALRTPVQGILDQLKSLTDERPFDPQVGSHHFTIAANDFQRDLLFPGLLNQLHSDGIDAYFRFMASGVPAAEMLRQARCDLIVTPVPPDGSDIFQTRLFDDSPVCFYDAAARQAPKSAEEFKLAEILEVRFDNDDTAINLMHKSAGLDMAASRVTVPNFSALASFLRGSQMITLQLSLMAEANLAGFAHCPPPNKAKPMTMYMVWHKRDHNDPAHRWLRDRIKETCQRFGEG